ncbi:hypothetical protein Dimus_000571 [Dionaea muscipula]
MNRSGESLEPMNSRIVEDETLMNFRRELQTLNQTITPLERSNPNKSGSQMATMDDLRSVDLELEEDLDLSVVIEQAIGDRLHFLSLHASYQTIKIRAPALTRRNLVTSNNISSKQLRR